MQTQSRTMMNFYRQYLLMFPEAGRFTDVTFIDPSERIKALLGAASDAVERSDVLKDVARNMDLKTELTQFWGQVKSGQIVLPDALNKSPYAVAQRGS